MICDDGLPTDYALGIAAVRNRLRLVDEDVAVKDELHRAGLDLFQSQSNIDKPHQTLQRRLKFKLHIVGVKVDIRVHRLDVHLIRIVRKAVVLRIEAAAVLDDSTLEETQDELIVLRIDLDGKRLHAALAAVRVANLDRPEGRKVLAKTAEFLPVVIVNDKNRAPCVLLQVVRECRKQRIQRVLQ